LDNRLVVLAKHVGAEPAGAGSSREHVAYANIYLRTALEYAQVGDQAATDACLVAAARLYPPLLRDHATYYELACSTQARGREGDARALDLAQVQAQLMATVERLAAEPGVLRATGLAAAALQAQVLWAVGVLQYQSGDSPAARRVLLEALRLDPRLAGNRRFGALLARAVAGRQQVTMLKRLAGRG
jgi:tetratricopeptide (TPR) repeat protein